MGTKLIIGTRGSKLALYQTQQAQRRIQELFPELTLEVKVCQTLGDRRPEMNLLQTQDRRVFCGELERALLDREIDLAVHSVKDLPGALEPGLILAAYLEREDPRDVLVSRDERPLNALPVGARIGTSSIRRLLQLKARRSDLEFLPIRGNVETRIDKVLRGDYEATILALAGIRRLNLEQRITEIFSLDELLPAPGQGCIGIEIREQDSDLREILRQVNDEASSLEVRAERSFLRALGETANGGSCESGLGAYGKLEGERLTLTGMFAAPGKAIQISTISGDYHDPEALGLLLAERFKK